MGKGSALSFYAASMLGAERIRMSIMHSDKASLYMKGVGYEQHELA